MTCQECEIKLGMGEACRWLENDLRLNARALREMRVRPGMRWEWALAAAAVIAMAVGIWAMSAEKRFPAPPVHVAVSAPRIELPPPIAHVKHGRPHTRRREPTEPLRVKMFTSDPDVVIYWIVDRKERSE